MSHPQLAGGFNPSEKYDRQIGHLPQIGVKIPKIFELPPPSQKLRQVWPALIE